MIPVGGLRARLIKISVQEMVRGGLESLGWFDATIHDTVTTTGRAPGTRRHRPVTFHTKRSSWDDPIELNSVVVAGQDVDDTEGEIGSNLSEDRWFYFVDVYGESDSVAEHITHDVRDILRGKMAAIGRTRPVVDVHDIRHATPPLIAVLPITDVEVDRARFTDKAWQAHWYSVSFILEDWYYDDDYVNEDILANERDEPLEIEDIP